MIFSKTEAPGEYGKISLGDLWDDKYVGKVCVRAHSSLSAMGRWLDSQGKLPKPWVESYYHEDTMKQLWDIALAEATKHKANIAQFWNGENDAQAAYRTNGAVIGLNWDSTGYNLRKDGFGFLAPKEGAFAWNQGFVLLSNAKNVEQGLHGRRLGGLGERLLGQRGGQGRNRSCRPGREDVLRQLVSGRRPAEAVVVAPAGRLVRQAARRIRGQVEGSLIAASMRTAGPPCRVRRRFLALRGIGDSRQKNMNGLRHNERGSRTGERLRGFRQFPRG
jgi:hypothetical protein